jgi:predicted metal-binding protein
MRILVAEDEFEQARPLVVSGVSNSFAAGTEAESSRPACRLLVCVGPRCDAQGRGRVLLAALREELAANPAAAARVEVTTRDCLRGCTRDPVVRLEPSGDLFSDPTVGDLLRAAGAAALESEPTR